MLKKVLASLKTTKHHKHYYEFNASCPYELGKLEGQQFSYQILDFIEEQRGLLGWKKKVKLARPYLDATKKSFPDVFEELRGQADALNVSVLELFALVIEDELGTIASGKCTSLISSGGHYFAHNEDWSADAQNSICIVKRTVAKLTTLELFYLGTLGGNSISVNSNGIIQSINSLSHNDHQIGVPKTIISRYMANTINPADDIKMISSVKRSSGFHHLFYSIKDKKSWSWECSAKQDIVRAVNAPFVHTNHYLTSLKKIEYYKNMDFSHERFSMATQELNRRSIASKEDSFKRVKKIILNHKRGLEKSIYNRRTIAQAIIDCDDRIMHISLAREKKRGWIPYSLDFIK
jgi:hypothetical protein